MENGITPYFLVFSCLKTIYLLEAISEAAALGGGCPRILKTQNQHLKVCSLQKQESWA